MLGDLSVSGVLELDGQDTAQIQVRGCVAISGEVTVNVSAIDTSKVVLIPVLTHTGCIIGDFTSINVIDPLNRCYETSTRKEHSALTVVVALTEIDKCMASTARNSFALLILLSIAVIAMSSYGIRFP